MPDNQAEVGRQSGGCGVSTFCDDVISCVMGLLMPDVRICNQQPLADEIGRPPHFVPPSSPCNRARFLWPRSLPPVGPPLLQAFTKVGSGIRANPFI